MIGTITNAACIVAGSILGTVLKKGIKPHWRIALYNAMGLCALVLGINAFVTYMPKSENPVLFIVCLALGALIGFMADLSGKFDRLIDRYSKGEQNLATGLSTAILLFCIGPLSMLGPVKSALEGDNTYLFTNATLDIVTSTVLASTYGLGIIWSAAVLFIWQGGFFLAASISASIITEPLMTELNIVGGILIASSGLAILGIKDCRTLNMLPAIILPPLYFIVLAIYHSL